jgi:hypothetical protein
VVTDGLDMALPTLAPRETGDDTEGTRPQPKREHILLAAVAVVVVLAGGWYFFLRGSSTPAATPAPHRVTPATATAAAGTAAPVAGTTAAAGAKATTVTPADAAAADVAAYVAKANAICTDATTAVDAIDTSDTSINGAIAVLDQEVPLMNKQVRQLRALSVPTGHVEFAKMWDSMAQTATLMHQARGAMFDGNPNTTAMLVNWALQDQKTLDQQLSTAGLNACV